MMCIKAY